MARTPDEILRDIIGSYAMQIAALQAEIEALREELAKRASRDLQLPVRDDI
jgi:uncharacterized small protein (DUF1192 family)